MTNSITSSAFALMGLVAVVTLVAFPSFASAANYAYVNTSNNVSSVTANDWRTAISTAFNIHPRSGVLLLTTQNSNILGSN